MSEINLPSLSFLQPRMDQYFNQMEKIVKERKTSSRIRFMLQDVIDLRLVCGGEIYFSAQLSKHHFVHTCFFPTVVYFIDLFDLLEYDSGFSCSAKWISCYSSCY